MRISGRKVVALRNEVQRVQERVTAGQLAATSAVIFVDLVPIEIKEHEL
jgi:hypothetical protein